MLEKIGNYRVLIVPVVSIPDSIVVFALV